MNFTTEIRRDLIRRPPEKRCCRLALLNGFLDTSGSWSMGDAGRADGFSFTSESEEIAEFLLGIVQSLFGVRMDVERAVRDERHGRDKLTFGYFGAHAAEYVDEITDMSPANDLEDCCAKAYLTGAFLGSGSCTLPHEGTKTGYHLEIVFHCGFAELAAGDVRALTERFKLLAGTLTRGDHAVVYFKSREAISYFLSVLGANAALGTLEAVSTEREENNNKNRFVNCAAGNADRAAIASVEQVFAFGALERAGLISALPEPLAAAARARLAHPEQTLSELAAGLGITKSGLNHRFRKLMTIYAGTKHD